ncbi:MAG TPA: DUF6544 family protein [Puia sp.]|uniref:DUF6544 family protein n=1 Tax=Puia sp. TaxID=2045100 RepID=UPI002D0D09FF|nr:DUF6544 family protein [Puia sp.]HVU94208.1 DUF6544 family protein [Puia sp.]
MTTLHELFLDEIRQERGKFLSREVAELSSDELAELPAPVRRYMTVCGFAGRKKQWYAQLKWANVEMKLSRGGRWRKMECQQFNSVPDPVRIVHMRMRVGGVLPLEARDKFQSGRGNMLVRLLKIFTIEDVRGREMDESALVTVLSEALLIPAYAVQPYIRWEGVGPDRAAAFISAGESAVHGLFSFNEAGEFVRFETLQRWRSGKGGHLQRTPWRVTAGGYVSWDGIRHPTKVTAAWLEGEEWVEYFRGELRW